MAKAIELCKVYSFTTLPNLCQRTTVWNTDAPNCYISQWIFVSDSTEGAPWFINFVVLNILW